MSRNTTSETVSQLLTSNGLWCVSCKWRYQQRWLVRCGVGYFLTTEDLALPEYEGILPQWQASLEREQTCLLPTGETFSAGSQLLLRAFVGASDPTQTRIYLLERYIHLLEDPAHFWLIHPRAVLVTNADGEPVGAWATFRPRVPITRLGRHGRRCTGAPLIIDPIPQAPPCRNLDELFERLFE